jgi:hypothetical protein
MIPGSSADPPRILHNSKDISAQNSNTYIFFTSESSASPSDQGTIHAEQGPKHVGSYAHKQHAPAQGRSASAAGRYGLLGVSTAFTH